MSIGYEIEKGIPKPERGTKKRVYPFHEMAPGDSIFFANQSISGAACRSAHQYGHRHNVKFTCRTVEGGVRIWRD